MVFIFGNYVKPARTMIAETHGIKETPFRANGDATVRGLRGDYRTTKVGLMLRWFKQLAMRGCARELDENGVAKPMRLYFSTDHFQLMVDHWERAFPGAPMPKAISIGDDDPQTDPKPRRRKSVADELLKFLASTTKDEVSSSDLLEATGIEMKSAMRNLREDADFLLSCEKLGWSYVFGRGRGRKARFMRTH